MPKRAAGFDVITVNRGKIIKRLLIYKSYIRNN